MVAPVVLSAASAHGVLADLQLRVVLGELGAVLPVPSFLIEEDRLENLLEYVDSWRERYLPALAAVAGSLHLETAAVR